MEVKREHLDRLADIFWWLKGYVAGVRVDSLNELSESEFDPFSNSHFEALEMAVRLVQEMIKTPKEAD